MEEIIIIMIISRHQWSITEHCKDFRAEADIVISSFAQGSMTNSVKGFSHQVDFIDALFIWDFIRSKKNQSGFENSLQAFTSPCYIQVLRGCLHVKQHFRLM